MSVAGPAGLEIAPLGRRVAARAIDAVAFLIPVLLAGAGGAGIYTLYRRRGARPGDNDEDEAWAPFGAPESSLFRRVGESPVGRLGLAAATVPVDVSIRNWRTPGDRVMGLRRVDARNGGPVSVRSALLKEAVQTASREANRWVQRPVRERHRERMQAFQAELRQAHEIRAGDREAQKRAMTEVLKRSSYRPLSSCGRGLLEGVLGSVPLYLPALWSARNQTLPDLIAGIVTVRD